MTRPGIETGEACQRTSHSLQPPNSGGWVGGFALVLELGRGVLGIASTFCVTWRWESGKQAQRAPPPPALQWTAGP